MCCTFLTLPWPFTYMVMAVTLAGALAGQQPMTLQGVTNLAALMQAGARTPEGIFAHAALELSFCSRGAVH